MVLNAPVGSHEYIDNFVMNYVVSLEPSIVFTIEIEHKKISFQLLRTCFRVCKAQHLLLVVPLSCTKRGTIMFDRKAQDALRHLAGSVLYTDIFTDLKRLVQPIGATKSSYGLVFSSEVQKGPAFHLSSSSSSNFLSYMLLSEELRRLETYDNGTLSHQEWTERCEPNKILPLSSFTQSKKKAQKALIKHVVVVGPWKHHKKPQPRAR